MKSDMGNLTIHFYHMWSLYKYPLNRQVFYFIFFFLRMMRCLGRWSCNLIVELGMVSIDTYQ